MSLHPCVACGRHVRNNDAHCPFCSESRAPSQDTNSAIPRVRRAAMVLSASLAMSNVAACDRQDAAHHSMQSTENNSIAAPYGAPPNPPMPPPPPPQPAEDDAQAAIDPTPSNPPQVPAVQPTPATPQNRPPGPMTTRYGAPPAFDDAV
ncbi:MAG: hypothetical protein Q8Q09_07520 [Deltaproteobacteria bacterium]|nr:hypothetical protein [Deltaproteobacteria bacterium]